MKKLKISKNIYNKFFFLNHECYLVFTFFNLNLTMVDLLKRVLEDNFNYIIPKIKSKFNITNIYLEIDIEDYFDDKEELLEFFCEENFKFYHSAVYYKNNYIQPTFFENAFLLEENSDIEENNDDKEKDEECDYEYDEIKDKILFFIFFAIINSVIKNEKIIFYLYNVVLQNKNLFLYKCLQSIKQRQN